MSKWALLSVSDKKGIVAFAKDLVSCGYNILSTGGTAKLLKENKIQVLLVSEYTGSEEILGGRVKTLHPKIYAGILAKNIPKHKSCMYELRYDYIDIVVVNLYPFRETISKKGVTFDEAIEQIDIGGPTMLRAAAKNCDRVTAICDPNDYEWIAYNFKMHGIVDRSKRRKLAFKVFSRVVEYNVAIESYLLSKIDI